jgi:hypothetical protein
MAGLPAGRTAHFPAGVGSLAVGVSTPTPSGPWCNWRGQLK